MVAAIAIMNMVIIMICGFLYLSHHKGADQFNQSVKWFLICFGKIFAHLNLKYKVFIKCLYNLRHLSHTLKNVTTFFIDEHLIKSNAL